MKETTICKQRKVLIVPSLGEENEEGSQVVTLRNAHFLEPFSNHKNKHVLPKPPTVFMASNNMSELKMQLRLNMSTTCMKVIDYLWKEWVENLKQKHQHTWKQAGIYDAIQASTYCITGNKELVFSLAVKWCSDTNTFVFPWGEATITLEDVMILGGFSVTGWVCKLNYAHYSNELMHKLKDIYEHIKLSNKGHVNHNLWMKSFKGKGGDLEHVGFLVMWLSRSVFNPNLFYISRSVFTLAISLSYGTKFALAPMVLAAIYRDLSLVKSKIMQFNYQAGNSCSRFCVRDRFVILWAYERFPILSVTPRSLASGEPRIARWETLQATNTNLFKEMVECDKTEFVWRPYTMKVGNWVIPKFYCDKEMWVVLNPDIDEHLLAYARCLLPCELDGVDFEELYLPHRVGMQFGFDQDIPNFDPSSNCNVEVTWSSYCKKLDGFKFYFPSRLSKGGITLQYLKWMKTWPHQQIMSERCKCNNSKIKQVEKREIEIMREEKKKGGKNGKKRKEQQKSKGVCQKRKRKEVFNTSLESASESNNDSSNFLSSSSSSSEENTENSSESWNEESMACEITRFPSQISLGDRDEVQTLGVRRRSQRLMSASLAKRRQERASDKKEGLNSVILNDGIEYIIVDEEDSEETERHAKRGECSKYAPLFEAGKDCDDDATSKNVEVKALFGAARTNNNQQSKKSRKMKSRQNALHDEFANVAYTEEQQAKPRNTKKASMPYEEIRFMVNEENLEAQNNSKKKALSRDMFPQVHKCQKARREASTRMRETISRGKLDEEVFSNELDPLGHTQTYPEDGMVGSRKAHVDKASLHKSCHKYAKPAPEHQHEEETRCIIKDQYNETNQIKVDIPAIVLEGDAEQAQEGWKKDEFCAFCKGTKGSKILDSTCAAYCPFCKGKKSQGTKEVHRNEQTTSNGTLILHTSNDCNSDEVFSQDPEPKNSAQLEPLVGVDSEEDRRNILKEKELKMGGSDMKLNVDNGCLDGLRNKSLCRTHVNDQPSHSASGANTVEAENHDPMIPSGTEDGGVIQDPTEPILLELEAEIRGLQRVVSAIKAARASSGGIAK